MLVVGAGPGGGELARQLAVAGISVTLVDRLPDLNRAAFSSAAMPLRGFLELGLPAEVLGSRWSSWQLLGPSARWRGWCHGQPLGVVLDFAALRHWLAQQVQRLGGEVRLGWSALACEHQADGSVITTLRSHRGELQQVHSTWVVDASGQQRSLIGEGGAATDPLIRGVGLEWLLQLPEQDWQRWADQLSFVLGSAWVPQGYGWVFPMQSGLLKVGVCRLCEPGRAQPPLQHLQQRLLRLTGLGHGVVLDRHGGEIRSRVRRSDPHGCGQLLALGDAVSTGNLLGGEGIRYAMLSARVLAPLLLQSLLMRRRDAAGLARRYQRALSSSLGWRWALSGRLGRRTWLGLSNAAADKRLEHWLGALERCSAEDLSRLLFEYRFERFGLRALPYLLGVGR
ncbi:MAG: NAD(P)/FAD-dependent oxidoreductase [Synechococcus sp.]|nr:NAD(P)/FAD-dependent oxidoreductase [Synechococcus sp.]